jgi:hypothetical protein
LIDFAQRFQVDVKKVPNGRGQGLDPGESPTKIFRFGCRKAANDKKAPDPVGSEVFVLRKFA